MLNANNLENEIKYIDLFLSLMSLVVQNDKNSIYLMVLYLNIDHEISMS